MVHPRLIYQGLDLKMNRDSESQSDASQTAMKEFQKRLRRETATLMKWFRTRRFGGQRKALGLEIEAWLTNEGGQPVPENDRVIDYLNNPLIVPELSKFNLEFNSLPEILEGKCFSKIHSHLSALFAGVAQKLHHINRHIVLMGSLPNLDHRMLNIETMSNCSRYRQLNRQIMRLKRGAPSLVSIRGKESIDYRHDNVMMEAAGTSFQIHLQVPPTEMVPFYNASLMASAIMVAVTANTPLLFGKDLWAESRIPLFEQSLALPGFRDVKGHQVRRVTLGSGYASREILGCFIENLSYPVLLPRLFDDDHSLPHLRLHNGTIWRWNRPILGYDLNGDPSLRIEHRCPAAGPTITDMITNMAFYVGLVHALVSFQKKGGDFLPFPDLRYNFYLCAKFGLHAKIKWPGCSGAVGVVPLITHRLLPQCQAELKKLGICSEEIAYYLEEVLVHRLMTGRNGCDWQRHYHHDRKGSFDDLVCAYREKQNLDIPVSRWTL